MIGKILTSAKKEALQSTSVNTLPVNQVLFIFIFIFIFYLFIYLFIYLRDDHLHYIQY